MGFSGNFRSFYAILATATLIAAGPVPSAHADSMDDQIKEASDYLAANPMKMSPKVIDYYQNALKTCSRGSFEPSKNPDNAPKLSVVAGGKAKAASVYDILHHEGGETDRNSNFGIRNWMRASVTSDCRLYRAARIFLKELQKKDLAIGAIANNADVVPIQKKATFDVLTMARAAVRSAFDGTRDDVYLAQKVLAIYGHDNANNQLYATDAAKNRCEYAILDIYKPQPSSTLYRNGAIAGLDYAQTDVTAGEKIAKECKAACSALPAAVEPDTCLFKCNDFQQYYQADYYHVVAASYLVCFAELNSRRGTDVLGKSLGALTGVTATANTVFDAGYPALAKVYKKKRFVEEMEFVDGLKDKAPAWARIAKKALDTIPSPVNADKLCGEMKIVCSTADVRAAQAIIDRYRYEIELRAKQHEMGQKWAQRECAPGKASIEHPVCAGK